MTFDEAKKIMSPEEHKKWLEWLSNSKKLDADRGTSFERPQWMREVPPIWKR